MKEIENFKSHNFKYMKHTMSNYTFHLKRELFLGCSYGTNFNRLQIYHDTPLSPLFVIRLTNIRLSIFLNNCFKVYMSIILLLSILSNHIVNCQKLFERDNILFISRDNLNGSVPRYLKSKHAVNNNILKYYDHGFYSVSRPLTTESLAVLGAVGVLWSNNSRNNQKYLPKQLINIQGNKYDALINNHNRKSRIISANILENFGIHAQNQLPNSIKKYTLDDDKFLLRIVMEGLGLQKLPDIGKANISQLEYRTKYNEYFNQVRNRRLKEMKESNHTFKYQDLERNTSLTLITLSPNQNETTLYRSKRSINEEPSQKNQIFLQFPLNIDSYDIEEANIRLLLVTSPALAISNINKRHHTQIYRSNSKRKNRTETVKKRKKQHTLLQTHMLNLKVYQILGPNRKVYIDGRKIEINFSSKNSDGTTSQWIQFDVTRAVESWLVKKDQNLGLEIHCDNCFRNGARIVDDMSESNVTDINIRNDFDLSPVLNIIGRLGIHREKRSKYYHKKMTERPQRRLKNDCYKNNQRCCRHSMEVVFKDIKDFEFIIQPKVFDAGYCHGRCPPRFNPAHHHALLQSLIWKQDRAKAPRPCCAPSKLIELDVLHVDEKNNEKLKISTWTDMRVLECACS